MDQDDDFQFIDVGGVSNGDREEPLIVSDLTSLQRDVSNVLESLKEERKSIAKDRNNLMSMQKILENKIEETENLKKKQEETLSEFEKAHLDFKQLQVDIRNELDAVKKCYLEMEDERTKSRVIRDKLTRHMDHFEDDKRQLDELLGQLSGLQEETTRSQNIQNSIAALTKQVATGEHELERLQELHRQQQDIVQKQKIELEKMRSNVEYIQLPPLQAYSCKNCKTHIAKESDIESRCYQVGQGTFTEKKRGFLFCNAVNLKMGPLKTESFSTGSYGISWVRCIKCDTQMGWKYVSADNPANKNKVDKYCLARYELLAPNENST